MALGYLIDPFIQVNSIDGTPVVGARIYVYNANTTNLAVTYNDFLGHMNTNPVKTDTLGNCTIIADDARTYDVEIRDEHDLLLMSKKNLAVNDASGASMDFSVEPGYGISVSRVNNIFTVSVDTSLIATKDDLATKQDKLYAGDNIEIDDENQINVVGRRELQAKYPIRLDRSNNTLKVYLDADYAPSTDHLVAGPDIAITRNAGYTYIGVDTNSTASGSYNFYAGNSNAVSGNDNAVFGYGNDIVGDYNAGFGQSSNITGNDNAVFGQGGSINGDGNFIAGQSNNSISGYGNAVFGTRNTITNNGTYNIVQGADNNVNHGSNNLVVGSYNETNGHNNLIGGSVNSLYCDGGYYVNNLQLGDHNTVSADYVNANLLYGDYNTISGGDNSTYRYNIIGGSENTFDCGYGLYNTLVLGYRQTFSGNNAFERNIIVGEDNTFDNGLSNSLVIGSDNSAYSNNVAIIGDGHNVSAEYNARLGKYSTNGDYWFAIGNGTNDTYRSNVFEVRKNGDSYYKYNGTLYQMKPASTTRTNFDKTLTTTYTVQANDENITIPLTDAIAEYITWHNTNRSKLTSPTYMFLEIDTDTQVNTAGMIYVNMYYNGISTAEPILKGNVYIDKFWSGLSMAYCNGVIPSNTNLQNAYWWLELRNISTGTKWLANTVITVKVRFIGTAISYS